MKEKSAVEILNELIELLIFYLEDLNRENDIVKNEFILGELTAYVECLEIVQKWKDAPNNGLNFDIEARFPV